MTGYGRSEFRTAHGPVRIEVKSVNHKFFELSPRLPNDLVPFTDEMRRLIQGRVLRGKIFLTVHSPDALLAPASPPLNEELARGYFAILTRLNRVLGLKEKITLTQVARMPDVITLSVSPRDADQIWTKTRKTLGTALLEFDRSRLREGALLVRDMLKRAADVEKRLKLIQKRAPKVVTLHREKLLKRLAHERGAADTARERAQSESAAFAKSCDITEEVVPLSSQLGALKEALREGGEVGRKIDFIAQEMNREANTMGAKSNDFGIANHVVHIKAEIEKMREQGQNVE